MKINRQLGAVSVEFAITMSVLLLTVIATMEFSRLMIVRALFDYTVSEVVRELKRQPEDASGVEAMLTDKWQEQVSGWGVFLAADRPIDINSAYYSNSDDALTALQTGTIVANNFTSQALGIYQISYPVRPLLLGGLLSNFDFHQNLLVQHEQ